MVLKMAALQVDGAEHMTVPLLPQEDTTTAPTHGEAGTKLGKLPPIHPDRHG